MDFKHTVKRALYIEPFLSIPKHEKLQILGHFLQMKPLEVLSNLDLEIPEFILEQYLDALKKLQSGMPVQYITNTQGFYELDFYVDENVLIPRPETEVLVQTAIDLNLDSTFQAIDIGTGSGCIAISLAKKYTQSHWIAVDISVKALEVARKNSILNQVKNIEFRESNLLENISESNFDLITANLPYIGTDSYEGVDINTKRYEPNLALFSGSDGLDLYRKLFKQINQKNIDFKYFLIEHADNQEELLLEVIKEHFPNRKSQIIPDLNKINRIILIF